MKATPDDPGPRKSTTPPSGIRAAVEAAAERPARQVSIDVGAQVRYLEGKLAEAQAESAKYFGTVQKLVNQLGQIEAKLTELEAEVVTRDELIAELTQINDALVAKVQIPDVAAYLADREAAELEAAVETEMVEALEEDTEISAPPEEETPD